MEIWIAGKEGNKEGPLEGYLVRERIEAGEFSGEELAWHKDQKGWVRLREMDLFRSAFDSIGMKATKAVPPPLPVEPYPFLRFFARWFDISAYILLLSSLVRLGGNDLFSLLLGSSLYLYLYFLPWVALEAILLTQFATSPGKYLLGIRIVAKDGGPLRPGAALTRSLRAFIVGLGLMVHPFLTGICHIFCLWHVLRRNKAPWDLMTSTRVEASTPRRVCILRFCLLFLAVVVLLSLVLIPSSDAVLEFARDQAAGAR